MIRSLVLAVSVALATPAVARADAAADGRSPPPAEAQAPAPPRYQVQPIPGPADTGAADAPDSAGAASASQASPPADAGSPPPADSQQAPLLVEHQSGRPALEIVAIDAGYGALAGALVGGGIALIDEGNHLGRNLLVGAGAGILVGAAIGGVQAYGASRSAYAMDGLGTPQRDPPLASAHVVASYAGRF